ncbi:MAG: DUF2924 domain-containing protein [Sphingobium sp.]|uniref:DUF2924 domain-containing protein n=1 Tax=Sphingobium sp. TaxID=1912891 RepID=UPI0029BC4D5C|nr:DUF2924 domain-containing protein [Sphingobium sp.]MDX3910803.1 DUF2924 domain-containing protein [Sphingobium sp.]
MKRAAMEARVAALPSLSSAQLRSEWLQLYKAPAASLTTDLLRRGIAGKLQEKAGGGYRPATLREIERLCRELGRTGEATSGPAIRIKPGTRLVRSWGGVSHHVVVLEKGFLYREQHYASLSSIARLITGATWSGPRFFGLASRSRTTADA